MTLFLWKKSYELKIPEIDVQHRRLVGLINELSDAMMAKRGERAVPHILDELTDYIQLHFKTEENIMLEMGYPELNEHIQLHLDLTGRVLDFQERYFCEKNLDARELLVFLCDWLKEHVIVNDKKFETYVRREKMGLNRRATD